MAGAVTHNDPSSIGACVALAGIYAYLLGMDGLPAPRWWLDAFLLETIPSALYILARHAADAEEAIVRAVNDTRDNDTIAAIVGAVVGALHGQSGLPRRWVAGLLGRTGEADDGRLFDLVDETCQRWGQS